MEEDQPSEMDRPRLNPVSGRYESENERLDRNFNELLQELRVAQTGVQILFAFLLTAAFTPPMQQADQFSRNLLSATILSAALATALLIAPVALHRTVFRQGLREQLVRVSSRLAVGGLVLLTTTMLGGCLVALDTLLPRTTAMLLTAGVAVWFAVFWLALPARVRFAGERSGRSGG